MRMLAIPWTDSYECVEATLTCLLRQSIWIKRLGIRPRHPERSPVYRYSDLESDLLEGVLVD